MSSTTRRASATQESLHRIFTIPEAPDSTLGVIEKEMSENLLGFLGQHIVAVEKPLNEIEKEETKKLTLIEANQSYVFCTLFLLAHLEAFYFQQYSSLRLFLF